LAVSAGDITTGTLAAARLPAGTVLQVLQTHVNTTSSQSISGGVVTAITGLTINITPTSTSSKFLVSMYWSGEGSSTNNYDQVWSLKRTVSATDTFPGIPTGVGTRSPGLAGTFQGYHNADANSTPDGASFMYLDSPSASTAITYTVCLESVNTITLYNNRPVNDGDTGGTERLTSQITVMEISG
jgi:hypothetical protein